MVITIIAETYRCEAEKFTDSPLLHKTSKKQKDTSDSKPEMDESRTLQVSTNPESNTGSDSAPGISQMKFCVPVFGVLSIILSPVLPRGIFPKYLDKALEIL